jgi:hypothetical protein
MPEYTYICNDCNSRFCIICSIREYKEHVECLNCKSLFTIRAYEEDLPTLNMSVRLASSEIKTLGHLAHRNSETMSEDQKNELYRKHNSYKEEIPEKPLPKGMKRIKKPKKIKWK